MIGRPKLHLSRRVSLIIAGAIALVFAAGTGACSDSAAQTVRMVVTGASVFDAQPLATIHTTDPAPSRDRSSLSEALSLFRYTIVGPGEDKCILTASLGEGAGMPAGSSLALEVKSVSHSSTERPGGTNLSTTARKVLAVSGSSATGADGASFTYTLEPDSRSKPAAAARGRVAVTLTLTDGS
jgi:hypothetical protein